MTRARTSVLTATLFLFAGALALILVLMAGKSSGPMHVGFKIPGDNAAEAAGEGPLGGYEAYRSAERTYPANVIPPRILARAKATFNRIARRDARLARRGRRFLDAGH